MNMHKNNFNKLNMILNAYTISLEINKIWLKKKEKIENYDR